jgi:hypothetical protein
LSSSFLVLVLISIFNFSNRGNISCSMMSSNFSYNSKSMCCYSYSDSPSGISPSFFLVNNFDSTIFFI